MAHFVPSPERFFVTEIPAYRPSGEGEHLYLWIEKRDLTTPEAVRRLSRGLGIRDRDVGYAGLKDRHATTRQYLSVCGPTQEAVAAAADSIPELAVLESARHGNKLRLGHLRGNEFEVVVTDASDEEEKAIASALAQLAQEGLPNRFGQQRFGRDDDNVARALDLLAGRRRERDKRKRQFLFSALQSAVFNRYLDLREQSGGLWKIRQGDVLRKTDSGGLFVSEDPAVEAERIARRQIVPTGPLPGNREMEPPAGSEARALEDQALHDVGATREALATLGRALPGARRPVTVLVELGAAPCAREPGATNALRLHFSLPAGSYATTLLDAVGIATRRV